MFKNEIMYVLQMNVDVPTFCIQSHDDELYQKPIVLPHPNS